MRPLRLLPALLLFAVCAFVPHGQRPATVRADEPRAQPSSVVWLGSVKDAADLLTLADHAVDAGREGKAVADANALLGKLPPGLKIKSRVDLDRLLNSGMVRIRPSAENYLVSMNLRRLGQAMPIAGKKPGNQKLLAQALANHSEMIESLLGVTPPKPDDAAAVESLRKRIERLDERFLFLLDYGFDPAGSPAAADVVTQIADRLGTPATDIRDLRSVTHRQGGKELTEIQVGEVVLDLGLDQPLKIKNVRLGNADIGFFYPHRSLPINGWVEELRRTCPRLKLPGGVEFSAERIILRDQVIVADLALDLPGIPGDNMPRRVVFHNVVRRAQAGRFSWRWNDEARELFVGKGLSDQDLLGDAAAPGKLRYDAGSGILSVRSPLTTKEFNALSRCPALSKSVPFGVALQLLREQRPRLDMGGYVQVGAIGFEPLLANMTKLPAGAVRLIAVVIEDGARTEAAMATLRSLSAEIEKDPRSWLTAVMQSGRAASKVPPAAGAPFRVVLQVAADRVALGGVVSADGGVTWEESGRGLSRIRTNAEILSSYLTAALPLLPEPTGAPYPVRIDEIDFDPAIGELAVRCTWATPGLDAPAKFALRVPLRPGAKVDWRTPVGEALSGRTFTVGTALELRFAERQGESGDWSASVEAGGLKLPMRIGVRDGRLAVTEWDRATADRWLGEKLQAAGVKPETVFDSVTARLDVSCRDDRVAATLCFDIWPGPGKHGPKLEVRLDRSGVYVIGLEAVLGEGLLAELRKAVPEIFGLKLVRVQRLGAAVVADADLTVGGKLIAKLNGLQYAEGKLVSGGTLELSPEGQLIVAEKLKLEGKGWRAGVTRLSSATTGGLLGDVKAVVDHVGELRLSGVRLGPKGLTVEVIAGSLGQAIVARLPELKPLDLGPFQVSFGKPRLEAHVVEVPVTSAVPSLGVQLRFPKATFRPDGGWALGPMDGQWPDIGPLTERLGALARGGLGVDGVEVRATNPQWETRTLEEIAVTFDLEVAAGGRTVTVQGNRFGRDGFRPGDLSSLKELAVEKAADLLNDLEWWKKSRRVELGPVAFSNIMVKDRHVSAHVEVLGGPAGRLVLDFPQGGLPKLTWEEREKLLDRLKAWPGGWPFRLAQDRVEIGTAELLRDGVRLPVSVKLPELDMPSVEVGWMELRRSGLRLGGADDLEAVFWKKIASAVSGRKFTPSGLPFEAVIRRADSRPNGLDAELFLKVDGLGEVSAPFGVTKDGVRFDRDAVITSLAGLVQKELARRLPQGRVALGTVTAKDGGLVLPFRVDAGLSAPIDVTIRIDRAGVHGLDAELVATTALNELAAQLDGQSLEISSDIVLKIPKGGVRVSRDPRGVILAGEAKLGPVSMRIEELFFDGKKADLAHAKITPDVAAVTKLFGELGFAGVSIEKIVPELASGRVLVGCKVKLVKVLEAVITARIGRDGFSLALPITFSAGDAIQLPLAPSPFLLTGFEVTIAEDHLGGGCTLTLIEAELKRLIRMDAKIRIPFKGPKVITVRGDLILMSILPAGNAVATVDFDQMRFETTAIIGVRRVIELDGQIVLDFGKVEFHGEGSLKAFGASLAHAKVYVNRQRFGAEAMLNLLLVYSSAKLDGVWSPLSDTNLEARVAFGFFAFGQHVTVAGAHVEASLRPSAKFTAEILGQDIVLADVDLGGITLQRIIDAILRQPICLTGFKLFASEGGGGVANVLVGEDGSMHLKVTEAKSGRLVKQVSLVEEGGAIRMAIRTPESGGGVATRVLDPARDRETTIREPDRKAQPGAKPDIRTRPVFGKGERASALPIPWIGDWIEIRP